MNLTRTLLLSAAAATTLSACMSARVKAVESAVAATVGDDMTALVADQIEQAGFTSTAPTGNLEAGDIVTFGKTPSRYMAGQVAWSGVEKVSAPLALTSYTHAEWGASKFGANDLTGRLATFAHEGGGTISVEATFDNPHIQSVDLGTLIATPSFQARIEELSDRAGGTRLHVVAAVVVADGVTVGTTARRGANVEALLRPAIVELEGAGVRGAMTEFGYVAEGPVVIGYRLAPLSELVDATAAAP